MIYLRDEFANCFILQRRAVFLSSVDRFIQSNTAGSIRAQFEQPGRSQTQHCEGHGLAGSDHHFGHSCRNVGHRGRDFVRCPTFRNFILLRLSLCLGQLYSFYDLLPCLFIAHFRGNKCTCV